MVSVLQADDVVRVTPPARAVARSVNASTAADLTAIRDRPSALDHDTEIRRNLGHRPLALFLDFDGTLSAIVSDPATATLIEGNRERLERLSELATVGIISGRDLDDVRARVGMPQLYYAGSHGFDLGGPDGWQRRHEEGDQFLRDLNRAERDLRGALAMIPGAFVERKHYAIAVHDRRVPAAQLEAIRVATEHAAARYPRLRLTVGKRIRELRPNIAWGKGGAALWLRDLLGLTAQNALAICVGDDLTDEDGFRGVTEAGCGFGIVVGDEDRETAARYRLRDPAAVSRWLDRVIGWLVERDE